MRRSRWALLLLTPLLIYGVARFCHHQTAGFKVTKITSNCPRTHSGDCAPLPINLKEVITQKFTLFGQGKQSFAFLSEDKTTVLKLFNNRYQRLLFWHGLLPYSDHRVAYFAGKLDRIATSYELAESHLKEETGLLYLHLAPTTHLKQRITLVDKLGIAHTIDLDTTGFALQRRGTLAYTHLDALVREGKQSEALEALHDLLTLVVTRCKRGLSDNDPLVRTNLGFIDARPFYIDIGPFALDEREKDSSVWVPEVQKITESVERWLEGHAPALASPFQEMVRRETTLD